MDDDARTEKDTPPTPAGPLDRRRGHALERARKSRTRTRRLLLQTTLLTGLGVIAFFALFWRGSPRPNVVEMDAGAAAPAVPIVTLRGGRVLLDGVEVGTTEGITESGRMQRLDGLFDALKRRRIERDLRERSVVLDVAADVPAIVVKSAFQTAAFAGYPDVSFAVREAGAP